MAYTTGSPQLDAALIALIGVTLVQFVQWCLSERRLRFDKKAQEDRKAAERSNLEWKEHLAIRKEVYLKAAEELAQAAIYLIRCGDLAMKDEEHAKIIQNYGPALMKVHLVGTNDHIAKLVHAQSFFGNEIRRFMPTRIALRRKGDFVKALDDEISRKTQMFDSVMRAANDQTTDASQRMTALFEAKQISDEVAKLNALRLQQAKEYETLHRQFWAELIGAHHEFLKRLLEANIILRKEMGMSLDSEANYREIVTASLEADRDGLNKLYSDLMPPQPKQVDENKTPG